MGLSYLNAETTPRIWVSPGIPIYISGPNWTPYFYNYANLLSCSNSQISCALLRKFKPSTVWPSVHKSRSLVHVLIDYNDLRPVVSIKSLSKWIFLSTYLRNLPSASCRHQLRNQVRRQEVIILDMWRLFYWHGSEYDIYPLYHNYYFCETVEIGMVRMIR
jgi:hypothetical protein